MEEVEKVQIANREDQTGRGVIFFTTLYYAIQMRYKLLDYYHTCTTCTNCKIASHYYGIYLLAVYQLISIKRASQVACHL